MTKLIEIYFWEKILDYSSLKVDYIDKKYYLNFDIKNIKLDIKELVFSDYLNSES